MTEVERAPSGRVLDGERNSRPRPFGRQGRLEHGPRDAACLPRGIDAHVEHAAAGA